MIHASFEHRIFNNLFNIIMNEIWEFIEEIGTEMVVGFQGSCIPIGWVSHLT